MLNYNEEGKLRGFFFRIQKLIFSLNFLFLVSTKLSQNISGYGFFSLLFLHILYTMDFYFFFSCVDFFCSVHEAATFSRS